MKFRKGLCLAALLAFLLAAGGVVIADDYGYTGGPSGAPTNEQILPAPSSYFRGDLAALNENNHELLVNTVVPGLLGPEERVVPFRVGDDTTLTVCFEGLNSCESAVTGPEGWDNLMSLERFSTFAGARKNVVVVGDPESDRIVHVEIDYEF
jgi:hypothetical protein